MYAGLSVLYAVVQIGWSYPLHSAGFVGDTEGINSWEMIQELTGLKNVVPRIGRSNNDMPGQDNMDVGGLQSSSGSVNSANSGAIIFPESRMVALTLPSDRKAKRGPPTFKIPDHWRIGGRKRSTTGGSNFDDSFDLEAELNLFKQLRLALKREKDLQKQQMFGVSPLPMRYAGGFRLQSTSNNIGSRYKRYLASVMSDSNPQVEADLKMPANGQNIVEDFEANSGLHGGQDLADLWKRSFAM